MRPPPDLSRQWDYEKKKRGGFRRPSPQTQRQATPPREAMLSPAVASIETQLGGVNWPAAYQDYQPHPAKLAMYFSRLAARSGHAGARLSRTRQ